MEMSWCVDTQSLDINRRNNDAQNKSPGRQTLSPCASAGKRYIIVIELSSVLSHLKIETGEHNCNLGQL